MRDDLASRLPQRLGLAPSCLQLSHGMPVLQTEPPKLIEAVRTLRDEFGFDMLLDVTAVDWLPQTPRFELVWHFFASSDCQRLRLKTRVAQAAPVVPSLVAWYGSAAFMERECHDMFGIVFDGNADLRPILLYEGFVGHPLCKDYDKHHEQPLVAYRDEAQRSA